MNSSKIQAHQPCLFEFIRIFKRSGWYKWTLVRSVSSFDSCVFLHHYFIRKNANRISQVDSRCGICWHLLLKSAAAVICQHETLKSVNGSKMVHSKEVGMQWWDHSLQKDHRSTHKTTVVEWQRNHFNQEQKEKLVNKFKTLLRMWHRCTKEKIHRYNLKRVYHKLISSMPVILLDMGVGHGN